MLSFSAPIRVFLYTAPTDMRKSFSGLHGLVVEVLKQDPLSGDWFVFLNRRHDRIKLMAWERDGFSIYYKNLEPEDTHFVGFPAVRQAAYNCRIGPIEVGRMV
jgi:transposase